MSVARIHRCTRGRSDQEGQFLYLSTKELLKFVYRQVRVFRTNILYKLSVGLMLDLYAGFVWMKLDFSVFFFERGECGHGAVDGALALTPYRKLCCQSSYILSDNIALMVA